MEVNSSVFVDDDGLAEEMLGIQNDGEVLDHFSGPFLRFFLIQTLPQDRLDGKVGKCTLFDTKDNITLTVETWVPRK